MVSVKVLVFKNAISKSTVPSRSFMLGTFKVVDSRRNFCKVPL